MHQQRGSDLWARMIVSYLDSLRCLADLEFDGRGAGLPAVYEVLRNRALFRSWRVVIGLRRLWCQRR